MRTQKLYRTVSSLGFVSSYGIVCCTIQCIFNLGMTISGLPKFQQVTPPFWLTSTSATHLPCPRPPAIASPK